MVSNLSLATFISSHSYVIEVMMHPQEIAAS